VPAIVPLINALSLDATASLVALGFIASTLTVTGATNATPIVLTFAAPHNILSTTKASVVVSGIVGNTAANGTFLTHYISSTQLALYNQSLTGIESPVAGNGAYASGGIAQTAFSDGGIVVGRIKANENWAPPRCIFIPKSSRFGPRSTPGRQAMSKTNPTPQGALVRSYNMTQYGGGYSSTPTVTVSAPDVSGGIQATAIAEVTSNGAIRRVLPVIAGSGYLTSPTVTITDSTGTSATAVANLGPTAEVLAQMQQRSLMTEFVQFEVQVWGANNPSDYNADFDLTQAIYHEVLASSHRLAPGQIVVSGGVWVDSLPTSQQMDLLGHLFKFQVEFATPVLDTQLALAPAGVRPTATVQAIAPDTGTVEVVVSGQL
jgi:hypothetical protein